MNFAPQAHPLPSSSPSTPHPEACAPTAATTRLSTLKSSTPRASAAPPTTHVSTSRWTPRAPTAPLVPSGVAVTTPARPTQPTTSIPVPKREYIALPFAPPPGGPTRSIWRGGYNSGKTNTTNNLYLSTEDGINRVAIRSTLTPGTIKVTASRDGLKPATVTFTSSPVAITGGLSQEVEVTLSPFATK